MPTRTPLPVLNCVFNPEGEQIRELLLRCFHSFLYKALGQA